MSHTILKVSLSSSPMDLLVAGASVPPCLPPKPPDADLDMMLPVDPPDPPVPSDPPPLPALWVFHRQISTLCTAFLHYSEEKGLLLLENCSATWNFKSKSKKLKAFSRNLEAYVLSPENPHISSSLMGFDDQRFRPSSIKAYWLRHGNVGVQSFDLTKAYALSLNPVQLTFLVWYDVFSGTLMVLVHRLASVDRVHIAQSRDGVLKFVQWQRRHFPTSRSYGSHRRIVLSVTFLFVEVKESPPGHDLEAPVHGSLGHCYIGFPLLTKATAMRSALCLELTLEFPKLKAFSDNSTLIRAISSNLESKEVIGIVSNIRSISSGFASIGFSHLPRSKNSIVDTLAKKALHIFSSVEWTPEFGPCFGFILSFYY
ncbi:hypothetical protein DY000_02004013 [Brassica cretica]|uniref:RNase H type-1 domain-containing protein n=1 Tax=Brassica cretica TaxID=69181 RepID=A0ABQ7CAK8_BRACR|nr:hypothetical protein DY000_02004013 [Brassica cretica]